MMRVPAVYGLLAGLVLLLMSGCGEDLPAVKVDVERFEQKMLAIWEPSDEHQQACLKRFQNEFSPVDRQIYADWILGISPATYRQAASVDSNLAAVLCRSYASDDHYRKLADSVLAHYPSGEDFNQRFQKPLARFKKYFPEETVPKIRTIAIGMSRSTPWEKAYMRDHANWDREDGYLGLSLDYYCGADFPFLHPQMPRYLRRHCNAEHLNVKAMLAMMNELHAPVEQKARPKLVDYMVNAGIRLYAVSQLLPEAPDSALLRYPEQKRRWVQDVEPKLFNKLLPHLFTSNPVKYEHFINRGPFTKGISKQSPARLAEYFGLAVVRTYMEQSDAPSLTKLVSMRDYEAIFRASGYKP